MQLFGHGKCDIDHWVIFCMRFLLSSHLWTRYGSSTAIVAHGQPLLNLRTVVPAIWSALQARDKMMWVIPNSSATLVRLRLNSNFLMTLDDWVYSSRCHLQDCLLDISHWVIIPTSFKPSCAKTVTEVLSVHRKCAFCPSTTPTVRNAAYMGTPSRTSP